MVKVKLRFSVPSVGIADRIESATPCHDALVVGLYRVSNQRAVLAAKSEDYTTAPQHLTTSLGLTASLSL